MWNDKNPTALLGLMNLNLSNLLNCLKISISLYIALVNYLKYLLCFCDRVTGNRLLCVFAYHSFLYFDSIFMTILLYTSRSNTLYSVLRVTIVRFYYVYSCCHKIIIRKSKHTTICVSMYVSVRMMSRKLWCLFLVKVKENIVRIK